MAKRDWTIKLGKNAKLEDEKTRLKEKGLSGMVPQEIQGTAYGAGSFGPPREYKKPKNNNLLG